MREADLPTPQPLAAPPHWRTLEFISDLHLQPSQPATFEAWRRYMGACTADALFILGDLFEVWVGDDAAEAPGFEAECGEVLRATASRLNVFFMAGNRDFLVGRAFLDRCGVRQLPDPTVLQFGSQHYLLTHGDALCLDDVAYQAFRRQVRDPAWQEALLKQPLAARRALGRQLRDQSDARKRSGEPYSDVDAQAARHWLAAAGARTLIHGHTHRPAGHLLDGGLARVVLSDWDADAHPPRCEVLRLDAAGLQRVNLLPC